MSENQYFDIEIKQARYSKIFDLPEDYWERIELNNSGELAKEMDLLMREISESKANNK